MYVIETHLGKVSYVEAVVRTPQEVSEIVRSVVRDLNKVTSANKSKLIMNLTQWLKKPTTSTEIFVYNKNSDCTIGFKIYQKGSEV